MTHRFAICLAIAASLFAAPRPAAAAITTLFDTVDAIEIGTTSSGGGYRLIVTGIVTGGTTPTTLTFDFSSSSDEQSKVRQCERLALLAMSKPGKYQFGISGGYYATSGCKLTRRTP